MRLLLILSLVVSALAMALPASAAADHAQAPCHAAMGSEKSGGAQDEAPRTAGLLPMLHACPGCAYVPAPEAEAPAMTRLAVPRAWTIPAPRPSTMRAPLPEPPRHA